jgi:hypothetical protein
LIGTFDRAIMTGMWAGLAIGMGMWAKTVFTMASKSAAENQ